MLQSDCKIITYCNFYKHRGHNVLNVLMKDYKLECFKHHILMHSQELEIFVFHLPKCTLWSNEINTTNCFHTVWNLPTTKKNKNSEQMQVLNGCPSAAQFNQSVIQISILKQLPWRLELFKALYMWVTRHLHFTWNFACNTLEPWFQT